MLLAIKKFVNESQVKKVVYHGTLREFDIFYKSNGFGSARYRTEGFLSISMTSKHKA